MDIYFRSQFCCLFLDEIVYKIYGSIYAMCVKITSLYLYNYGNYHDLWLDKYLSSWCLISTIIISLRFLILIV